MADSGRARAEGVEGHGGILVIRGSGTTRGWNGIKYKAGLAGANVGAQQLSMNVATIPPGDFIFIAPGVPHEVLNLSDVERVVAVVARSDASEWEHIVEYPSARRG